MLIIAISSIIIATNYVRQIKAHTKAVSQCIIMIDNIEIYLKYNNLSIDEIIELLANSNLYKYLSFIKIINENIILKKSSYFLSEINVMAINKNMYLTRGEKDNIISFLSALGKSDLNGQISNCKTYKEIFSKSLKTLESKEQVECKSVGTLIIGVGLLFIIFII